MQWLNELKKPLDLLLSFFFFFFRCPLLDCKASPSKHTTLMASSYCACNVTVNDAFMQMRSLMTMF